MDIYLIYGFNMYFIDVPIASNYIYQLHISKMYLFVCKISALWGYDGLRCRHLLRGQRATKEPTKDKL